MAQSTVRNSIFAVLGATMFVACGGGDAEVAEHVGSQASAILHGTGSPAAEDYVVQFYALGGGANAQSACTGTLISPTLVITARHCVTAGVINSSSTQCILGSDLIPAETFTINVGSRIDSVKGYKAKRIIIDYSSDRCNADIAGIELTSPVTEVTSFPTVELDTPPKIGDAVTAIGWGRIQEEPRVNPSERQKAPGNVLGTTAGTYTVASGGQAVSEEGFIIASTPTCYGDSGSPLLDARGALLGVLNGAIFPESTGTYCEGGLSIYVPLYRYTSFVERLFQSTGKMPPRAGKPVPADLGGVCAKNNECNSNYCVGVGTKSLCSKTCSVDTDCGGALKCTDTGAGSHVCLDDATPPPREESCSLGNRAGGATTTTAIGVGVALAALVSRRRRGRFDRAA